MPFSKTEMLIITSTSAYKICVVKTDGSCTDTCSSSDLILDPEGNKCQSGCDSGKIKLMPEEICISSSLCDTNIYTFNSDNTQCGLCNYFYPSGQKYKLINTTGCLSSIPDNADFYNENLNLLKCKTNYHLDNTNNCVPDSCYPLCKTCFEVSENINEQKCISCNSARNRKNRELC